MPLSERTRNLFLNAIAISPIMKWGMLPGIIGIPLFAVGVAKKIDWLVITGLVLAAPVLWCLLVIMVVCPLILLFSKPPKHHWEE